MIHRTYRQSRGVTILEMIIVITITSLLTSIAMQWIVRAGRFATQVRNRQSTHLALSTFAKQFRDDVHEAKSVRVISPTRLDVAGGNRRLIAYRVSDGVVTRRYRDDKGKLFRDSIPLSPHYQTTFRNGPGGSVETLVSRRPNIRVRSAAVRHELIVAAMPARYSIDQRGAHP